VTDAPLLRPDWQLPAGVHAFVTTRSGGASQGGWSEFNLARHVGDADGVVNANRAQLLRLLQHDAGPAVRGIQWVRQVHGTRVFHAGVNIVDVAPEADALYSNTPGMALAVLTADCLPVLFSSRDGNEIAVAHAGWRGLLGGVLEAVLASFHMSPQNIAAWLGPAIGPCHFEVGDEVRAAFMARAGNGLTTAAAFAPGPKPGKWLADLYALARIRLAAQGVLAVGGFADCTVCHADRYYSYRRQPQTGRFATLIVKTG
jgi:polyphenol oxidase